MAKSIRSKKARRLRNARAEHFYETQGKHKLQELSARLHDPSYDMKRDYQAPPNAFLHPNNPNAKFPQGTKPVFPDYRAHKMAGAGLAVRNVFRNHFNPNAKQTKYKTITKTIEEIQAEEEALAAAQAELEPMSSTEGDHNVISQPAAPVSVDELTAMAGKMRIGKKPKVIKDVEMAPAKEKKTKAITKRVSCKKQRRQLK